MLIILSRNLVEEYAILFSLPLQRPAEQAWQFRLRIARSLEGMGETIRAHEVLWNECMSNDPSATGPLTRGYDERFVSLVKTHLKNRFLSETHVY